MDGLKNEEVLARIRKKENGNYKEEEMKVVETQTPEEQSYGLGIGRYG